MAGLSETIPGGAYLTSTGEWVDANGRPLSREALIALNKLRPGTAFVPVPDESVAARLKRATAFVGRQKLTLYIGIEFSILDAAVQACIPHQDGTIPDFFASRTCTITEVQTIYKFTDEFLGDLGSLVLRKHADGGAIINVLLPSPCRVVFEIAGKVSTDLQELISNAPEMRRIRGRFAPDEVSQEEVITRELPLDEIAHLEAIADRGERLIAYVSLCETWAHDTQAHKREHHGRIIAELFRRLDNDLTLSSESQTNDSQLRKNICFNFSPEELKILCDDMNIDYENFRADGKEGFVQELIKYCRRHSRMPHLFEELKKERPGVKWWTPPE
ncbi:MAG: hypothetical protein M1546_25065 [Chloroflexi bacterium]|nr:hypothetical protein [Chloroflexota bacterium]